MQMTRRNRIMGGPIVGIGLLIGFSGFSQTGFTENKGQWPDAVFFRADMTVGQCYIDQTGLTLQLMESTFFSKLHDWIQDPGLDSTGFGHVVKMRFPGADLSGFVSKSKPLPYDNHYFLGNDSLRWGRNAKTYRHVGFKDVYPGIDLRYDLSGKALKYDFVVYPGIDPAIVRVEIDGATSLQLDSGDLLIETTVGNYRELKPFAYQTRLDGKIIPVACNYVLKGNEVSYDFPEGYDVNEILVIDPEIAFSSYIGGASSSFGFTASYDADGSLYAGAVVFGGQYPVTAGAFQMNFAGGVVDVGISKFNATGTQLIYNTFLGGTAGSGNEAPHSIVVNSNNELYVFGSSSSSNFPVTNGAFQTNFVGGTPSDGGGISYNPGSDIFITRFNASGNNILASTFIGGSGNDGVDDNSGLVWNYGDRFRGEIVVDADGNAYVATITKSNNFPMVNGYDQTIDGNLSGVIFKMSANLQNLIWSTYSGGTGVKSAISLQLAEDNSVYFTGATKSNNMPVSANAYQATLAGDTDGYIGHISADGTQLLHGTYNGTSDRDQNYFVQLDGEGNVYVIGQQEFGDYPVSQGVYVNPNSGQYVQKFSPDLSTSFWSTQVGSGSNSIDISPSAFLVSDCGQIYISGWGGAINNGGNTTGMPVTPGAFQTTTDGSDFYVMVLEPDATDLVYATYFGGSQSSEHVDGGTSRFDKDGTVYQAVCAGCFSNDDFPTQPGVWSQVNGSSQCNLAVFKFRLSSVNAIIEVDAPESVCPGQEFQLLSQSIGADTFLWTLGDGNTSDQESLSYSFAESGIYEIQLVASASNGCLEPDSISVTLEVAVGPIVEVAEPAPICPGETVQLLATGANSYSWVPAAGLNFTNVANPVFSGTTTTVYTVTGITECGLSVATVTAVVGSADVSAGEDKTICPGESVTLSASGGGTYQWIPVTGLNDPTLATPLASPLANTAYAVTITTPDGCEVVELVNVEVLPPAPSLSGNNNYVSCNMEPVFLEVTGADEYVWTPSEWLSNPSAGNTISNPPEDITYLVTGSNVCGSDELEVTVTVNEFEISFTTDSIVCHNSPFQVHGTAASFYVWTPQDAFANPNAATTTAAIDQPTLMTLTGRDELGCISQFSQYIRLFPIAELRAGNDRVINFGDAIMLETFSTFPIVWDESAYLSCLNCNYPTAEPPVSTTFYANIESPDGCSVMDSVRVWVRGNIYVPNAFTPDGDGTNDLFKAVGLDISQFQMEIYDRWGNIVFKSEDINEGWNGSNLDSEYYAAAGLYPYRIVAREHRGELFELQGHVLLIR